MPAGEELHVQELAEGKRAPGILLRFHGSRLMQLPDRLVGGKEMVLFTQIVGNLFPEERHRGKDGRLVAADDALAERAA